jgi:prolyl-tRNA synthetase
MRVSDLFGETLREVPADVDAVSHQLLLRAGYVRPLATGIFSYLPLAQRALTKIAQIIRAEIDHIGGQELSMPVVHPAELWQESGRWQVIDAALARFQDRGGRDMLLAMTHEEVVTDLARREIRSYRQLPQLLYQIQTKFRDEPRARGGLIRVREFTMKDSYSLDRDLDGLRKQYAAHYAAYFRIYGRAGLPVIAVQSDTGMMGGKVAHEFMYLTPIGEDTLVLCQACGYAANREVAHFVKLPRAGVPAPLEQVATPETSTIAALAAFLDIPESETAKVVFLTGDYGPEAPAKLIIALVRGDMEANEIAIHNLSGANALRPATTEEIVAVGAVPGYASPIGIVHEHVLVIVDDLVAATPNLVAGANVAGYHMRNACYGRDYGADIVAPIAAAFAGAGCVQCGAPLSLGRGVEVGNIFQLGTRYSEALGATYLDEHGDAHPIIMGSYGIGLGRLLACVAEEHHDQHGLTLPISVAPYQVTLVALGRGPEKWQLADQLYDDLRAAGVEVLYDDRDARPGVKFADADLRGMPLRLTISDRAIAQGGVELKRRTSDEVRIVGITEVISAVQGEIAALFAELAAQVREETLAAAD